MNQGKPAEICPWCKEETSHTLEMCCLLQGGALSDRPYSTSGKLIRSTPIKRKP